MRLGCSLCSAVGALLFDLPRGSSARGDPAGWDLRWERLLRRAQALEHLFAPTRISLVITQQREDLLL